MTLELVPWRGAQVPLLGEVSRFSQQDYLNLVAQYQNYMGAPIPPTYYGKRPTEPISYSFQGFVEGMLYAAGPVAAAEGYRTRVFGQAPLLYQEMDDGRPGDLFDDEALDRLRAPWPGATLSDLMKRALVYGDMAGNAFIVDLDDELVVLRPDWVEIVLERRMHRGAQVGWRQVGIMYYEGGMQNGEGVPFLPGEYAHFVPCLPDPMATYRGMSWLTPLVREVQADKAANEHKLAFFENSATVNLAVSLPKEITPEQFEAFVEKMDSKHKGSRNAGKTLYTGGGADVTVIGANMQQQDFAGVQGKGETRVANAAAVPPVLLSFSEGMQGSSLNAGNYTAAKRNFVDTTMRDLWANFAGSIQQMDAFKPPEPQTRLWYDGRDIPFLHEDAADLANIQQTQAATINSYITGGWKPESAMDAVHNNDITLLEHTGLTSVQLVPPGGGMDVDGDGMPDEEPVDFGALRGGGPEEESQDFAALRFDPSQLRVDAGNVGGGRWRRLSDVAIPLLKDWAAGKGSDDPLGDKKFNRSQLLSIMRDLRKKALADGDEDRVARLTPRRGASEQQIKLALYQDARRGMPVGQRRPSPGATDSPAKPSHTAELDEQYNNALDRGDRDEAVAIAVTEREERLGRPVTDRERDLLEAGVEGQIRKLGTGKKERPERREAPERPEVSLDERYDRAIGAGDEVGAEQARVDKFREKHGRSPNPDEYEAIKREVREAIDKRRASAELLARETRYTPTEHEAEYERRLAIGDRLGMEQAIVDDYRERHGRSPEPDEYARMLRQVERDIARRERNQDNDGPTFGEMRADLWEYGDEHIERALADAYADLDVDDDVWRARYDLRVDKGFEGGGRFRKLSDFMVALLSDWAKGEGDDDPLDQFSRDQLRRVTVELAKAARESGDEKRAARLTPRRGASSDEIKLGLYTDVRAQVRAGRDMKAETAPKRARFTLQGPERRDQDVEVFKTRDGKPALYKVTESGRRGGLVGKFDDLAEMQAWAEANGEPRLADWARNEDGQKAAPRPATPAKRVPAKKAAPRERASVLGGGPADENEELLHELTAAELREVADELNISAPSRDTSKGLGAGRAWPAGKDARIRFILQSLDSAANRHMGNRGRWAIPDAVATVQGRRRPKLDAGALDSLTEQVRQAGSTTDAVRLLDLDNKLTAAQLRAVADRLGVEVPPRIRNSRDSLVLFLSERGRGAGSSSPDPEGRGPEGLSTDAKIREVQVENRIRAAYREALAAGDPGYNGTPVTDGPNATPGVRLSAIRDRLGESTNRHEVDEALRRLSRQDGVYLDRESNQKTLTDADREAALADGANMLSMYGPSRDQRPLPAGVDTARQHQADIDSARGVADLLSTLDEQADNEASPDLLLSRLRAARDRGVSGGVVDRLEAHVREVQVENRIRLAFREAPKMATGWVDIKDMRPLLADLPRADVDAALLRMRRGGADLLPNENQKVLTEADRDSAVQVGGRDYHWLAIDDPSPRALDRAELDRVRADIAREHGLTPTSSAGALVPFDSKLHQIIDGRAPRKGALVHVVRPGYELDRDGERIPLGKAVVEVATAEEKASVAKSATPKAAPASAANPRSTELRTRLDALDAEARPLADFFARYAQADFHSAEDHRVYDANRQRLSQLVDEGNAAARELLDILVADNGEPWGGDAEPTAARWREWAPVVSDPQDFEAWHKIRDRYVADDRNTIIQNASLRSDSPTSTAKSWATRISRMVRAGQVRRDTTLHRGAALGPEQIMELRPGSVLVDRGFVSADATLDTAGFYADTRLARLPGTIKTLFEIRVPAGTPAADVAYGEVVLDRNNRFRIISSRRGEDGTIHVVMELMP